MQFLQRADPEVYDTLTKELQRQRESLTLIASENYASLAVMEASGSVLTNKYSEGYPGKRYYAGNEWADKAETLAIERAKKLFGADMVNVQPHAGSQANMAAFFALLNLGDKIMGLNLAQGGHLTHGSPVNFSGKWYKILAYNVDPKTHFLDYDAIAHQAANERPDLILAGYTAYPRSIDFKRFREIADSVDAFLMADIAHIAGLVAGGAHPSPFPHADVVTTTTHKTLRGPRGAMVMAKTEYEQQVNKAVFPGLQGGPLDNMVAAKAVCFHEALQPEFKMYAKQVVINAKAMADELLAQGEKLVSGGTDNHLILMDLTGKDCTGKDAQIALEQAGLVSNRNTIPNDPRSPFITSGVRLGTPGLTTRGMREGEMKEIAQIIHQVLQNWQNDDAKKKARDRVKELCKQYPLYPELK